MSNFPSKFDLLSVKDNYLAEIDKLKSQVALLNTEDVQAGDLSELADDLGTIRNGQFITAQSGTDLGVGTLGDLTGTAMVWPGITVGGVAYTIFGANNGTLEWGASAVDGTLLAGAGAVILSSTGISATAGTIGGWTLAATSLTSGTGANTVGIDSGGTNPAFYAGSATPGSAPFRVTHAGALTATNATITGSITATTGSIGGWTIGATTISATNITLTSGAANTANILAGTGSTAGGINSAAASGDIVFWSGNTFANRATAPFRVTAGGALTATSATITGAITATSGAIGGWTIAASTLSSGSITLNSSTPSILIGAATAVLTGTGVFIGNVSGTYEMRIGNPSANYLLWDGTNLSANGQWIKSAGMNPALQEWKTNIVFSSASATQINWTSGTIQLGDGTTYTISSGNTGAMAALTYIYLDIAVSLTVLQHTTTYTTAVGDGKIIIAAAQNNATAASVIPYGGQQPVLDGAGQIAALSITAGSIAAGAVVASKISVTNLQAVSANMGALNIDNKLTMSGASSAISIGTTPPTGSTAGTGIWIDRTGLYGLQSNNLKFSISASSGNAIFSGGNATMADELYLGEGTPIELESIGAASVAKSSYFYNGTDQSNVPTNNTSVATLLAGVRSDLTNLIVDGTFESGGLTHWTASGGGSATIVTNPVFAGTYACQLSVTGASTENIASAARFAVTAGSDYMVSLECLISSAATGLGVGHTQFHVGITTYTASTGGSVVDSFTQIINATLATSGFIRLIGQFTPSATATYAVITITVESVTGTTTAVIDNIVVQPVGSEGAYYQFGPQLSFQNSDLPNPIVIANYHGASVYNSVNQSVNSATLTALTFDSDAYDTNSIHSTVSNTSRLTCNQAGIYLVMANTAYATNATGERYAAIRKNGATYIAQQNATAITGDTTFCFVAATIQMAKNDYVESIAYQSSGGALNVVGGSNGTIFSMQKVG